MNKPNYSVFRLTRVLTTVSLFVVIGVGIYSALLAVNQTFFRYAVSSGVPKSHIKIIIDAGHGGEDGGTQSASGVIEKDLNLSIALRLREIFGFFGYDTVMTREEDRQIYDDGCTTIREKKVSDTRNRMRIIEENSDGIFISIHQNYYTDSKYSGAQTFYSVNNDKSQLLASDIQSSISGSLQKENTRKIKPIGKDVYLLHHSVIPSVMVECGFLSNKEETLKLCDEDYQTQMALTVFVGTHNYFAKNGG